MSMSIFPEPGSAEVIDLAAKRMAASSSAEDKPLLEVVISESPEQHELPVLEPYQLALEALKFYQNSGLIIPDIHGEGVRTVRDQIRPPRLNDRSDLDSPRTWAYFTRFFELQVGVDTKTGQKSSNEDSFDIAQAIRKKTAPTSTVLSLMLSNPDNREIPAKAVSFSERVLKEIMHHVRSGAINLD